MEEIYNAVSPLVKNKVQAVNYGRLNRVEKNAAQEAFRTGQAVVMISTKAFGMGVDVPDIAQVYHYAPTGNLADYVQEIGRCARDKNMTGVATEEYLVG